jgi:RNA polymerase sigma-70 factor (ECF subfamily)
MASVALHRPIARQSSAMAAEEGVRPQIRPIGATEEALVSRRGERRLLREAQRGSEEALEVLVRRHWPLAHRAAYVVIGDAAAAEDVAQEALVAAIRSLDRFDLRRPFGPWLHRIAVNRAIDHARARAARGEVASGTAEEAELRGDAPTAGDGEPDPRAGRLRAALAGLSPEHRAIVAMRFLLDLSPGEIAAELDLPRGTVNSRLRRALDRLAADIGEER